MASSQWKRKKYIELWEATDTAMWYDGLQSCVWAFKCFLFSSLRNLCASWYVVNYSLASLYIIYSKLLWYTNHNVLQVLANVNPYLWLHIKSFFSQQWKETLNSIIIYIQPLCSIQNVFCTIFSTLCLKVTYHLIQTWGFSI